MTLLPARRFAVIGIAGGIGSGKSTVAQMLAELGCRVIDSDAEAKRALQRPDVIAELVRWWGTSVLDAGGAVDRRAVRREGGIKPMRLCAPRKIQGIGPREWLAAGKDQCRDAILCEVV